MAYGPRQQKVRAYRGQIPSPGRPTVAWRQDRVRFWDAIGRGVSTDVAAAGAGVSSPVGYRWFRGSTPLSVVGVLGSGWQAQPAR